MTGSAEIILYDGSCNEISISLSEMQTYAVLKVLGIEFQKDGSLICFSDEQIEKFAKGDINPIKFSFMPKNNE